jgi:MraZ protein
MFRGSYQTRLDEKGRLKIPADFKHEIERKDYDGQFYITSLDGAVIKLYPLKEWTLFEEKILSRSNSRRALEKFTDTTSYYGQSVEMDSQGRLTISERLRNQFRLQGEVAVKGKLDHLEIQLWDEFSKAVESNPLTPEDLDQLLGSGN